LSRHAESSLALPQSPQSVAEPPPADPEEQVAAPEPAAGQPEAFVTEPEPVVADPEPFDPAPEPEPDPPPAQPQAFVSEPAPIDAEPEPRMALPDPPGEPEPLPATLTPARGRVGNYYVPPVASRRPRVSYEQGSVPEGHKALIEQAADVAVSAMRIPLRVLDVGCGEGLLLAELIMRVPYAESYVGLDPLPDAVPDQLRASDPRLGVVRGAAETLPFADASFDLVIAMLSFAYWTNQRAGLAEMARVVAEHGKVVLVEATSGDGRKHSPNDIEKMLATAGLTLERTETVGRSRIRRPTARAYVAAP
jgi:SAM-dependent methyltransferase